MGFLEDHSITGFEYPPQTKIDIFRPYVDKILQLYGPEAEDAWLSDEAIIFDIAGDIFSGECDTHRKTRRRGHRARFCLGGCGAVEETPGRLAPKTISLRGGVREAIDNRGATMQPYHAEAIVNQEGKIILSLPFAAGRRVDVVVLPSDEAADDAAWKDLAAREFLRGYTEQDAAYDNYQL